MYLNNYREYHRGVGGIVVSIAAFQAVDPGSIPGQRTSNFSFLFNFYWFSFFTFSRVFTLHVFQTEIGRNSNQKNVVPPIMFPVMMPLKLLFFFSSFSNSVVEK